MIALYAAGQRRGTATDRSGCTMQRAVWKRIEMMMLSANASTLQATVIAALLETRGIIRMSSFTAST